MKWDARLRARIARIALVSGVALAATQLLPALPHDQQLVFRAPTGAPISALEATWSAVGSDEPAGGVQFKFEDRPPRRVQHTVSLPNGEYRLTVHAEFASPSMNDRSPRAEPDSAAVSHSKSDRKQTTRELSVNLEGGATIISLP